MARNFELRMAGQVLVLLPEVRSGLTSVECLVVGGRHKPMLALPMGKAGLESTPKFPTKACVFVDRESIQYPMIDATGYKIKLTPGGTGPFSLGNIGEIIDTRQFVGPVRRDEIELTAAASQVQFTTGTLVERGIAGRARGFEQNGSYGFDQEVASELVLDLGPQDQIVVVLSTMTASYTLTLKAEDYEKDIVMFLTSLCGWEGEDSQVVDFDEMTYVLPTKSFPTDIEFYGPRFFHPKTGTCPPKIITFR